MLLSAQLEEALNEEFLLQKTGVILTTPARFGRAGYLCGTSKSCHKGQ
ncbi:hypothetical protein S1OALGB6SA_1300 [Olavius algarvensis spirochete endosymbiont]|nr:hypothetical protein S1OALGB6SA_1300 [Olavius algarvensis spirochete endosymbiont]